MGDLDSGNAVAHYRKALIEVDYALEVLPDELRQNRFEDARSLRERLIGQLAALGG